jgi:hypothetical protein
MSTTETARRVDAAIAGVDDLSDTAPILARVADARLSEQEAADDAEAAQRRLESNALTAAAAFGIVVLATLTIAWPARHASSEPSSTDAESPAPATAGLGLQSPSAYTTSRPAGPVLRKAAELCTNLGRVSDVDELRALIVRAADLIDASGLIVWMSVPGAKELRPVLSHGYSAEMIARLLRLRGPADNAAADSASGQLRIVLARPGSSNGAVVAPSIDVGRLCRVVSAEIRQGGESSESVQRLRPSSPHSSRWSFPRRQFRHNRETIGLRREPKASENLSGYPFIRRATTVVVLGAHLSTKIGHSGKTDSTMVRAGSLLESRTTFVSLSTPKSRPRKSVASKTPSVQNTYTSPATRSNDTSSYEEPANDPSGTPGSSICEAVSPLQRTGYGNPEFASVTDFRFKSNSA